MQPLDLINKYYENHEEAKDALLAHSHAVARFAVAIAEKTSARFQVNVEFVEEAALLHDIGMLFTDTPQLGCHGNAPYIVHGVLGAELLQREGLAKHALVCERHIGVGLSKEEIDSQQLPLPLRDMRPESLEEKIITYADLFYSKTRVGRRSVGEVRSSLAKYGAYKVDIFNTWHESFLLTSK